MFVSTPVGFKQAAPHLINLIRVSSESRRRIRFHIKLPAAGGTLLAGVEISVALSLIRALVGKFVAAEWGTGIGFGTSTHELA